MKLSEWCKQEGISYRTGWNWFKEGKLPVDSYQSKTGTIIVSGAQVPSVKLNEAIIYCRVSSHDKKEDLNRQALRCEEFASKNGFVIKKTYKEIGSGMNDNRSKLVELLNTNIPYIIIENKDRLTRFGFNYIKILLKRLNTEIIVINNSSDDKQDLMKDLISVITSFCKSIYGMKNAHNIVTNIKNNMICD